MRASEPPNAFCGHWAIKPSRATGEVSEIPVMRRTLSCFHQIARLSWSWKSNVPEVLGTRWIAWMPANEKCFGGFCKISPIRPGS